MDLSNIVIVPKLSMVQLDMHKYGFDEASLKCKYVSEGKDPDVIFDSHSRQLESVEKLRQRFPTAICYREGFSRDVADKASLVIAAGGDEHLKYVTHYVANTPILGLNTDPKRSRGELLEDNIDEALESLEKENFEIKEETRIEARVNQKPCMLGMSLFALRRFNDPFGNFRYKIIFNKEEEMHRITSGLLVYTGNGVDDWSRGAGKYLQKDYIELKAEDKKLAWVVNEPNGDYKMLTGLINEGEELNITCFKDDSAAAPDAIVEHKVKVDNGDRVSFRIAEVPLRKVKIKASLKP